MPTSRHEIDPEQTNNISTLNTLINQFNPAAPSATPMPSEVSPVVVVKNGRVAFERGRLRSVPPGAADLDRVQSTSSHEKPADPSPLIAHYLASAAWCFGTPTPPPRKPATGHSAGGSLRRRHIVLRLLSHRRIVVGLSCDQRATTQCNGTYRPEPPIIPSVPRDAAKPPSTTRHHHDKRRAL